jgi:ferredoxin--NADP+ reductase
MPTYKVLSNRHLTQDTFVLRTERPNVKILAGQCFSLGTKELAINREYSMYSAADDPYVDFLIRKVPGGRVSSTLMDLVGGDDIEIGGPYGNFCLNPSSLGNSKYLFISTGTGIAPFHSYSLTFPNLKFELLHGIRFEEEMYDREDYPEGAYKPSISKPRSDATQMSRVTDALLNRDFDSSELIYLCGNRSMIIDCVSQLRNEGINGDSIFTETFF